MDDDKYLTVKDNSNSNDVFDINYLKNEGIKELQKLSGKKWTDYNIHDPGLTTLEILCFSLTELAYRTDTKIEDIFSSKINPSKTSDTFFSSDKILTSGVVTLNDLRRVILDIEEIKNIEIVPAKNIFEFKGLWDLQIELFDFSLSENKKDEIRNIIRRELRKRRVLCTEIHDIIFLDIDLLSIKLSVELSGKVNANDFTRSIATEIENYFSPMPQFQGLMELINEGMAVEDIFSGPILKNGFISEKNLSELKLRRQIIIADLINVVMELDKVDHIKELQLDDENGNSFNWIYHTKAGKVPRLNYDKSTLKVTYKGKESFSTSLSWLARKSNSISKSLSSSFKDNKLVAPKARKRDLLSFRSIQYDFPKIYGVGDHGLPVGATEKTSGNAKQFKGYLTFYDQIFANYFAKLNHAKHLFSLKKITASTATQILTDSPGIYWLYKPFMDEYFTTYHDLKDDHQLKREWEKYIKQNKEKIEAHLLTVIENKSSFLRRRNLILDHLLARFGYDLTTFEFVSQLSSEELIQHKISLLSNLENIGPDRILGVSDVSNTFETLSKRSGFEKYLYAILGLRGENSQKITDVLSSLLSNPTKELNTLEFTIADISQSKLISNLHLHAFDKNNFSFENQKLCIFTNKGDLYASAEINKQGREETLEKVYNKFKDLNSNAEGFYLIEHILLKPSDKMKVFGFNIEMHGNVIFDLPNEFSREERDLKARGIVENSLDIKNYEVIELGLNQYKIRFNAKEIPFMSCFFFESKQIAKEVINIYLQYFKDKEDFEEVIERTTKYNDFFNDINDPFSNIVTYILPGWPARFQNEAFKKYIEETILSETPAHIYANIIWLNFEQLKSFEDQFQKWEEIDKKEIHQKEIELDSLLPYLVRQKNGRQ